MDPQVFGVHSKVDPQVHEVQTAFGQYAVEQSWDSHLLPNLGQCHRLIVLRSSLVIYDSWLPSVCRSPTTEWFDEHLLTPQDIGQVVQKDVDTHVKF